MEDFRVRSVSPAVLKDTTMQRLYEWGDERVWVVKDMRNEGRLDYVGHGSGVWINNHVMITACHVPVGLYSMWTHDLQGLSATFATKVCDTADDTAVMTRSDWYENGDKWLKTPTKIGNVPPRGTKVYIIGFPANSPLMVTEGYLVGKPRVNAYDPNPQSAGEWIMYADAAGGNSGGAVVYIDDAGEIVLIGILTAGYPNGHVTFMQDLRVYNKWEASMRPTVEPQP